MQSLAHRRLSNLQEAQGEVPLPPISEYDKRKMKYFQARKEGGELRWR